MFRNKEMSVLAFANGFTLWQYKSNEDTLETVSQPGYFERVMTLMAIGDIVIINAKDGTAIRAVTELSPSVKIGPLQ